jgi:hypothetical protein
VVLTIAVAASAWHAATGCPLGPHMAAMPPKPLKAALPQRHLKLGTNGAATTPVPAAHAHQSQAARYVDALPARPQLPHNRAVTITVNRGDVHCHLL